MNLKVNGHDWLPYVSKLSIKRNDLDGPNAGRTMDGTMYRDRVATKLTVELELRQLSAEELQDILRDVKDPFFEVLVTDPLEGDLIKTMYTNNIPAAIVYIDDYYRETWDSVQLKLIER